jgi:hypothetical protein
MIVALKRVLRIVVIDEAKAHHLLKLQNARWRFVSAFVLALKQGRDSAALARYCGE